MGYQIVPIQGFKQKHYLFVNAHRIMPNLRSFAGAWGSLFKNENASPPELEAGTELGGRRGRSASANLVRPLI
jgi:hypothetical protein